MINNEQIIVIIAFLMGIIMFISHSKVNVAAHEQIELEQSIVFSDFMPFLSLLLLIGGSILLTLLYVSWRKYKGSKKSKEIKKHNSNY